MRRYNRAAATAFAHRVNFTSTRRSSENPYKALGLPMGATKAEIKKAYRLMARKYHPDAPGGSTEKFREIQTAYESIKSGVWVPRRSGSEETDGKAGDDAGPASRFGAFRYQFNGNKRKVSFDDVFTSMKGGRRAPVDGGAADDDEAFSSEGRSTRLSTRDGYTQAWFRFIILWTTFFSLSRITLLFLFPPIFEMKHRKPPPKKPRKPPPPKPITHNPMLA